MTVEVRVPTLGESVTEATAALLADGDIEFVHGRNIVGGCFAFTARRS